MHIIGIIVIGLLVGLVARFVDARPAIRAASSSPS